MNDTQPITVRDTDRLSAILDADECNRALVLVGMLRTKARGWSMNKQSPSAA
jgi:hypothetical protein